ncbi:MULTISPECIES: IS3 family transposase [Bacillus cereus group]
MHDYIEYYNTERIQEKLNYLSPIEYKKQVA